MEKKTQEQVGGAGPLLTGAPSAQKGYEGIKNAAYPGSPGCRLLRAANTLFCGTTTEGDHPLSYQCVGARE